MGKILSRDEILAAQDTRIERVAVPEWGGDVHLRSMTSKERDAWEAEALSMSKGTPSKNLRARVVAQLVCDEGGGPVFTAADVEALGKKSGAALSRIFDRIMAMANVSKEDLDAIEKN